MSADSSTPPYLTSCEQGVYLDLYIRPSASRSKIVGEHDGRLKVQVAAPPVDGKANEVLVKFLAKHLGVARTSAAVRRSVSALSQRVTCVSCSSGPCHCRRREPRALRHPSKRVSETGRRACIAEPATRRTALRVAWGALRPALL